MILRKVCNRFHRVEEILPSTLCENSRSVETFAFTRARRWLLHARGTFREYEAGGRCRRKRTENVEIARFAGPSWP